MHLLLIMKTSYISVILITTLKKINHNITQIVPKMYFISVFSPKSGFNLGSPIIFGHHFSLVSLSLEQCPTFGRKEEEELSSEQLCRLAYILNLPNCSLIFSTLNHYTMTLG